MKRRRWLGLASAFCAGRVFVGGEESVPSERRVVSWNLHHGAGLDGKIDLKRIADVLGSLKPDLVALQEVDQKCRRSGGLDEAGFLAQALGLHGFFAKAMDFDGGAYGTALLSRSKPDSTKTIALPPAGGESRAAALASFGTGASALHFVSVHLDHQKEERRRTQAEALLAALPKEGTILVAGDFNCGPEEASKLLPGFTLAGTKEAPAFSFPADKPDILIDHFLLRTAAGRKSGLTEFRIEAEAMASDHRPISARWRLQ